MFSHTSRYYKLPTLTHRRADGRTISYVSRRWPPERDRSTTLVDVRLEEGDRLDRVAAATLGAPELFWRICDANGILNPFDLTKGSGSVIKVPMPGSGPM